MTTIKSGFGAVAFKRGFGRMAFATMATLIATATAIVPEASAAQGAADWPDQPIRLIATVAPGSSVDIIARIIAPPLGQQLGQPVIVENKAGAGGDIGTNYVAKAPKNGYVIGIAIPAPLTVNPVLRKSMPFDPIHDIAPISLIATAPNVIVINPKVPAHNLKELVGYIKAHPGQVSFGSAGFGTSNHTAGELLRYVTKTDIQHVPYKGNSEALTDLLGGRIQIVFSGPPPVLAMIKSGQLRAIAVADYQRTPSLPDVPTVAEAGYPGAESPAWYGLMAPGGVPEPILNKLHAELIKVLARPEVLSQFARLGVNAKPQSRTEFIEQIATERARWTKLFANRHIVIDQ